MINSRSKLIVFMLAVLLCGLSSAETCKPRVAGSFYPADQAELSYQVSKFLKKVPAQKAKGDIIAMIVPHAGYPYSGQIAAFAYKELENKNYETVILIGASHRMTFDEIAVPNYQFFETPLGKIPVDQEFIEKLTKLSSKIKINNSPFEKEDNSLEVQLPFLQTTLKNFKIVPIFFGNISLSNCQALAIALSILVDDRTLIIASSDWSHYYPYHQAQKMDFKGIDFVLKEDLRGFIKSLAEGEIEACGAPAIITTMLLAPALGANEIELLKYANSGDVTGDLSRVVGYASIVFSHRESFLSKEEKKNLLSIARKTLENRLSGKKTPRFTIQSKNLLEKRGTFVTLTKNGHLRGCVGYIQPVKPLWEAVQEMVIEAATNDLRFSPVTRDELDNIKIEISVLSKLKRVRDISEIIIGRDGLYIAKDGRSGVLLPQVATEWKWDREEFLRQVCLKAGLPEEAWKEKDANLYRFSAEVFHE